MVRARVLSDRSRFALALGFVLALSGCEEKQRPWSQGDGPPAALGPPARGASEPSGAGGDAPESAGATAVSAGAAPAPDGPVVAEATDRQIVPGGPWIKCHEGLTLSGEPVRDVTRFGLLCGPFNGMQRVGLQAIVGLIGERDPEVTVPLPVAKRACYRIFAVADPNVSEIDVTVLSSRGVRVAGDHRAGRLAIVQPDRPFCALEDDTFTIEIRATKGSGRFAAEVWAIGEPRRRRDLMEMPPDETPMVK